jgi:hypothetical protein
MPKRLWIAVLVLALIAGCKAKYGGAPIPTIGPSIAPTATTTIVTATNNGNPLVAQPISEFNSVNGNPSGAAIATQNTDAMGKTTFTGLTPTSAYCWQYTLVNGNATTTTRFCGTNWANGVTLASP